MYKAFYGLSDNPFSIAPNPHYLFLSNRHREALVHLTYGLGETGGFVLLTGEVGTGKTTVSRCLLQQLPENTDTAFILNPSLTELELLASLCDELNISYGGRPTLKQLTDKLSQFLLANHTKGRNTVLIIDEAQHLRPAVLEQLRLLTNLETNTKKLLQVILIGQPELQQLLKRQELRQLAQRITARYHLLPLTQQETALYVQHRLQVAGRQQPLFNSSAINMLHRYSDGVPRLINLLCERALMLGYAQSKETIDANMVRSAAAEILDKKITPNKLLFPSISILLVLLTFISALYIFNHYRSSQPAAALVVATKTNQQSKFQEIPKKPTLKTEENTAKKKKNKDKDKGTAEILRQTIAQSRDADTAYASLLGLWGKSPYIGLTGCQAAEQQGLKCLQQQGGLSSLIRLNYPAVVYLQDEDKKPFYATLIEIKGQRLLLQLAEQQFWVDKDWFSDHFTKVFELLWQAPANQPIEIGPNAPAAQIQWLANALAYINNESPRFTTSFDNQLQLKLRDFQRQHNLKVDAIAGHQTLMQLNFYLSDNGPRLQRLQRHN